MVRTAEILLEYQPYIEQPPISSRQLYGAACANDGVTIDSWKSIWLANIKANKERFGSFKDRSLGQLFNLMQNLPCIVAGAGPSLKHNAEHLKTRGPKMGLLSCLHNFHFLEDMEANVDAYVTLDAGDITIREVTEGGTKTEEEYWALTEKRKLIAFIGTHPELLRKWRGEIYFFNAPVPDMDFIQQVEAIEKFNMLVSNGGNVLGACLYIAKCVMGANPIAYVGADFSFSYKRKFHAWDSSYDKSIGQCMATHDVFGNRVLTWGSYFNFKQWFDWVAITMPGIYVNCSEGGCLGAYSQGNIMAIKQQPLTDFILSYHVSERIREQCMNPETDQRMICF